MLRPSYAELMDIMSEKSNEDVTSRYTVVIAAAKRARQIIDGDEVMADVKVDSNKPVSIAVEEMREGKITVVPEGQGTKLKPKKRNDEYEIKKELEERAAENNKAENDENRDENDIAEEFTEINEVYDENEDDADLADDDVVSDDEASVLEEAEEE